MRLQSMGFRPQSKCTVTFRKYLVLTGITIFSTLGDSLLARGMKDLGGASLHNISGAPAGHS